jgi:flagellar motor switch protein FliN
VGPMKDTLNYLDCWTSVATSLFSQALAGEPTLAESLPKPMVPGSFGFAATIEGDEEGRFAVVLETGLSEASLLGEGIDQRAGWAELLKEVADAAVGELLAKTGRKCQITGFVAIEAETKLSRAFQLKAGDHAWSIQVNSELRAPKAAGESADQAKAAKPPKAATSQRPAIEPSHPPDVTGNPAGRSSKGADVLPSPGFELLLDVELEASLRFGAREMPLGEILDLGPGDVVQLDRHVSDPVDLIVGDKIVARGEVVLVNGNFGLRVTEVAEPQRRLESIRCLF